LPAATSYPWRVEIARVVLVTNVGQGFGRAVALAYGQAGYDVVCADPDVDLASKTAAEVEELGAQAIPVQADASAQLDVRAAFTKVGELFGALGGVVHVACQVSQTPFPRLSDGEFAELLREDLSSTFLVLREASRPPGPAWVVVVAPPRIPDRPQMAAVQGALRELAAAFSGRGDALVTEAAWGHGGSDPELDALVSVSRPRVNIVVPSRGPSDPRHDARLANTVRYLGSTSARGVSGATLHVDLPPPPRVVETLLPEVQAALDDSVRQDDRDEDRDMGVDLSGFDVAAFGGDDEPFDDLDALEDLDALDDLDPLEDLDDDDEAGDDEPLAHDDLDVARRVVDTVVRREATR
jgi:NAD(P)-dependent dehydrogenase (short-subunit alcohol dehydrogenase family)